MSCKQKENQGENEEKLGRKLEKNGNKIRGKRGESMGG